VDACITVYATATAGRGSRWASVAALLLRAVSSNQVWLRRRSRGCAAVLALRGVIGKTAGMTRLAILRALDELVDREDGLSFQRLARRLMRAEFSDLVAHAEKRDLGRDASFSYHGRAGVLFASLTATWGKLASDIRRAQATGPPFEVALFCTPKALTNERLSEWCARADELGVELVVREREWLVDECLRPRHALVAVDELRIPPPILLRGNPASILAGDVMPISEGPVDIGRTRVDVRGNQAYGVWSTAPRSRDKEEIVLAIWDGEAVQRLSLGSGADGDGAGLGDDFYVCWSRREENEPLRHSLHVWAKSSARTTVVVLVEELLAPPFLTLWKKTPALVYLSGGLTLPLTLSVASVAGPANSRLEIGQPGALWEGASDWDAAWVRRGGLSVTRSHRGKTVALVYGPGRGRLFALSDRWREVPAGWPFRDETDIADIGLSDGRIHCLVATSENHLLSATGDVQTGDWSDVSLVAHPGWHPCCATSSAGHIATWSGGPPLPVEAQSDTFAVAGLQRSIEVLQELGDDAFEEHLRRNPELNPECERFSRVGIGADPQSPLWVAQFDSDGRCVRNVGPVGYFARGSRWPQVAVDDSGRGTLLWERGEEGEVSLLSRWFQL